MASSFLGTGWQFKLGADGAVGLGLAGTRVAEASDAVAVRQSIWIILSTAPGERIARPDFGCRIHDLVFGVGGASIVGDVVTAVEDALGQWEPRIDVLGVDAYPHPDEQDLLLVDVDYSIRATNSRFNLVYPFYLT